MSQITDLNEIIKSGEEVPEQQIHDFREAVAESSEAKIEAEVGKDDMSGIMNWWQNTDG